MIPKIIHYCWFGDNPLPELAIKCIESWKKYCPDYEIKEWNEKNFNLDVCDYVREAYDAKKWAFVSDYARLYAIVTEGGIYMDTDVEVLSSLDPYLDNVAFSGFQSETEIPTGIMACEKGFKLFNELLHDYDTRHFKTGDGDYDTSTNVEAITNSCLSKGLKLDNSDQVIDGFHLYPKDVFCAKSYHTGIIEQTENTVTIHHFAASWHSWELDVGTAIRGWFTDRRMGLLGRVLAFPFTFIGRCKLEGSRRSVKHYLGKFGK
mgnify:CR=1 FL=1